MTIIGYCDYVFLFVPRVVTISDKDCYEWKIVIIDLATFSDLKKIMKLSLNGTVISQLVKNRLRELAKFRGHAT